MAAAVALLILISSCDVIVPHPSLDAVLITKDHKPVLVVIWCAAGCHRSVTMACAVHGFLLLHGLEADLILPSLVACLQVVLDNFQNRLLALPSGI